MADFHPDELKIAFEELEAKDPVAWGIYSRRRFTVGKPPTLAALGEELGITRERVRQLEQRMAKELDRTLAREPNHSISLASASLGRRLGRLARRTILEPILVELQADVPDLFTPWHRVQMLLELAGPYVVLEEEWLAQRDLEADTEVLLADLTRSGPVPVERVVEALGALGVEEENTLAWLQRFTAYVNFEDQLVAAGNSLSDKGVAILEARGEPMTLDDIFTVLKPERNVRSFKNQMQADKRVLRRGIKQYGLTSWGGEEYTTIIDEMTQEIERRGGRAVLDELAEDLSRSFGISASSVRMHADGAQFSVDEDGIVTVPDTPEVPETKPLPLTRNCYCLPSGWALRRVVDHDVLRGSGSHIPLGFAKELGVLPGDSRELQCPHGPLRCSWKSHQANIGSIRAVAEQNSAKQGDYIFIVAVNRNQLDFLFVAQSELAGLGGLDEIAKRCGCASSSYEEVERALGVDARAPGTPEIRVRQQLLLRDESDLAALLRDEEDLLDALADL